MSSEIKSFEFGEFLLDTREKVLLRRGKPLTVTPKVLQLLLALIENHGHIVEKNQLMETVWADTFVEESNLTFTMRQLRKILGDDKHQPRFIETVPKRGYRFIGDVTLKETAADLSRLSSSRQTSDGWRSRPVLISILTAIGLGLLLTTSFFFWRGGNAGKNKVLAQTEPALKFETLTSSAQPITAAISPDGKYVAYVSVVNNQKSLWLRQLSSGINTQIIAPADGANFYHLEFSADGEYVYFANREQNKPVRLDRVSIFGGAVKTAILNDLDGAFSISPDDRRISFRRYTPQKRVLLVADIDGRNEREISSTTKTFTDNVFSPDGRRIAFAAGQSDTGEQDFGVYTIDPESGETKPATDFRWLHVRSLVWLPDQSGLLVTARVKNEPQQVWEIRLTNGEVKKVTDSQSGFLTISATADLSQILLTETSLSSNLCLAPSAAPDDLQPLTQAWEKAAWTRGGSLVYDSRASGNSDIWLLDADRTTQKQLTTETSTDFDPQVSPDGRYIVFVSHRAGKYNLWRMDADGGNPVQITNGEGEQQPVFTPDGAFVVFNSMKGESLWRVPVEGGEAERIFDKPAYKISISPDGAKFAHFADLNGKTTISIKSFPKGEVLQEFAIPEGHFAGRDIVWTKDGDSLIYIAGKANSGDNLWKQTLDDGKPQKLTNYNSDKIFSFAYSPDGAQLALTRGSWNHNVVLVKGYKE